MIGKEMISDHPELTTIELMFLGRKPIIKRVYKEIKEERGNKEAMEMLSFEIKQEKRYLLGSVRNTKKEVSPLKYVLEALNSTSPAIKIMKKRSRDRDRSLSGKLFKIIGL